MENIDNENEHDNDENEDFNEEIENNDNFGELVIHEQDVIFRMTNTENPENFVNLNIKEIEIRTLYGNIIRRIDVECDDVIIGKVINGQVRINFTPINEEDRIRFLGIFRRYNNVLICRSVGISFLIGNMRFLRPINMFLNFSNFHSFYIQLQTIENMGFYDFEIPPFTAVFPIE